MREQMIARAVGCMTANGISKIGAAVTLKQKAKDMRHAIDMMEGAMMGWDELMDMPENCALDENDADDLELEVKITWKHLRRVLSAVSECNRIINSDEYLVG